MYDVLNRMCVADAGWEWKANIRVIRQYTILVLMWDHTPLEFGGGNMFQTVHQKPTTFTFRLLKYINLIIPYMYLRGNNASQRLCSVYGINNMLEVYIPAPLKGLINH